MRSHLIAPPRSGRLRLLARQCAATLLLSAATSPSLWAGTPALTTGNPRVTPAVEAARRVRGAVVNIHSERTVPGQPDAFHSAGSVNRVNGMGTGIVIDPRGYIVTNNHVVEDVQVIRCRLADGTSYSARVLARDPENDLAVIKIDTPKALPTVPLGTASDLMVLEPVIAIGNAFGYEHTHTMGTVSSIKRDVALNKEVSYKGLIQTDASINPGNSGGPLLNMYGELVGVNVAIRAGAQNIGFAISVDTMIRVAGDLLSLRRRTGISHGMQIRDLVDTSANPVTRTCVVDRIEPGSLADRAGIQPGDQILQSGGVEVKCSLDVERGFLERLGGERVTVTVRRGLEQKAVEIPIPTSNNRVVAAASPVATSDAIWRQLGLRLSLADTAVVTQVNPQLRGGVLVQEVDPEGAAARAGIQRGDILIGLHQFETLNPDNVSWVLNHPDLASFNPLKFYLIRGGQVRHGLLPQIGR